jgi:hypothetical protein
MAVKKTNGHDPMTKQMVDVLERIEKQIQGLRQELHAGLEEVRDEVHLLRVETQMAVREVQAVREVHHVVADLGSGHEARIAKLEEAVFRRAG